MNLYAIKEIESQIEQMAEANEGEIPDEMMEHLIETEGKTVEKVGGIVRYIKHLEYFIDQAKAEKARVNELQKKAEARIESIKKYMTPLLVDHYNGKLDVDTFKLSTRKSEGVELDEGFYNPEFCEAVVTYKPDKTLIKNALKNGTEIPGARLESRVNLQIK